MLIGHSQILGLACCLIGDRPWMRLGGGCGRSAQHSRIFRICPLRSKVDVFVSWKVIVKCACLHVCSDNRTEPGMPRFHDSVTNCQPCRQAGRQAGGRTDGRTADLHAYITGLKRYFSNRALEPKDKVVVRHLYMRPIPKLYPKSSHASRVGITLCFPCESFGVFLTPFPRPAYASQT